jgi:hypothetical protein
MISFLALHRIAAQRGEGLRPELVSLLERWGCSESDRTYPAAQVESGDCFAALSSPGLSAHDTDTSDGSSPLPAAGYERASR